MQIFLPFIGRKPTTWPANNCLQIMVCSCAMLSNYEQNIICSQTHVNETTLFSFVRSFLRKKRQIASLPKMVVKEQTWWSSDKTILELGNRKISWFVSVSQINYYLPSACANNWSARHWQITIFCTVRRHNTVHYTEWISPVHFSLYSMKYIPIQAPYLNTGEKMLRFCYHPQKWMKYWRIPMFSWMCCLCRDVMQYGSGMKVHSRKHTNGQTTSKRWLRPSFPEPFCESF